MSDFTKGPGQDRLDEIRSRMRAIADCEWGQAPWDALDKEDLLFLLHSYHAVAQRAFKALDSVDNGRVVQEFRDAVTSCQAAVGWVFSDYPGLLDVKYLMGGREVDEEAYPGMGHEEEVFQRRTMKGVTELLAFDVPRHHWWLCGTCEMSMGRLPGKGPMPLGMKACEGGTRCSFKLATWDDWRRVGREIQDEAGASSVNGGE